MAVAISSITTSTNDGSTATVSVTTSESPTATQVGDLVVVVHGNNFYTLANMPTPTATGSPTLTSIVDADGGTNQGHIKTWYYYANTGGAQTVSVTETGAHDEEKDLAVFVLTGAAAVSPIDGSASGFSTTDAQPVCPTISPATSNAYVIAPVQSGGAAGPGSYTPPGTLTEKYDVTVGQLEAAAGIAQLSASGATGTFTWTNGVNRPYASATFAIKSGGAATVAASGAQILPLPLLLQVVAQRQASPFGDTGVTATDAPAEVASSTGTAFDASVSIAPNAEATTATGTAFDAVGSVGSQPTAATATGTAFDAAAAVAPAAGAASATGTAFDASAAITVNAEATSSTGTAFDATVSTASNTNAPAEVASGTGSGLDASVAITVSPAAASATGSGLDPMVSAVEVATATGTAFNATVIFVNPVGANVPIASTSPAGTFVSESGTGQTQQTVAVAIVSEGGIVIVSQTLGGVL